MTPCGNEGLDKGIVFVEGPCPATDPRLTWDYTQDPPLLGVGGKMSVSGTIATSGDVDISFLALQALGTGSFNFTPPSGYGGLIYRGGSQFYYWNNSTNSWTLLDFHVSASAARIIAGDGFIGGGPITRDVTLSIDPDYGFVNLKHNGIPVGSKPTLDFQDSPSVTWGIGGNGSITISAYGTGGGSWLADVNAEYHSITNLACINGILVSSFLTSPFSQNVNANNFGITNISNADVGNNLSVGGTIFYHGKALDDIIQANELWTAQGGNISRNSNVSINGALTVATNSAANFLYLDSTHWSSFAARISGTYVGELGFSARIVELWATNALILRGHNSDGSVYFPGYVGFGVSNPTQKVDVAGNVNSSGCYLLSGVPFACKDGSGAVNLYNIAMINGSPLREGISKGGAVIKRFNHTYHTEKARFVSVSVVFHHQGEVAAYVGDTNPPTEVIVRVAGHSGTRNMNFWVLPNQYYQLFVSIGDVSFISHDAWSEWY